MDNPGEFFDVIIIGGGPGGLAAAMWCADLGLKAILLEKENECGGQLNVINGPITNYPGVETSNGREMRDIFTYQVDKTPTIKQLHSKVIAIDGSSVTTADGNKINGRAIIIATGVRRRKLNVPGENDFAGRGVLTSGVAAREKVAGKQIVIVGGGDAALENALILGEIADKVTVIHRRNSFSARRDFVERAKKNPRIEFVTNATVTSINGSETVESIEYKISNTDDKIFIMADKVLIRIGVTPNSEPFRSTVEVDNNGYIITDKSHLTNTPNIFAIGDIANPNAPTISGATGDAATSIKAVVRL